MRGALSRTVATLRTQEVATTVQLHTAVCSLVDLTAVPAATWTSRSDILAFIEASFGATLKADAAAVADISSADVSSPRYPQIVERGVRGNDKAS